MPLSEKQKQKKLAKKKHKRKIQVKGNLSNQLQLGKPKSYAKFPIHECLMPNNLFETGIGNILVTRLTPEGNIAVCAFIVDVFCLGVKNTLFNVGSEHHYEQRIKPQITESHGGNEFERIHQSCARKLIEGAVNYAKDLGFNSHPDYKNTQHIFGDIDSSFCPVAYIYGQNDKPFYIRGPHETVNDANKIVEKLHSKCGEGGFDYMIMLEE